MKRMTGLMSTVQKMETWVKRVVAAVFLAVGVYYIVIVYGPIMGLF